MTTLIQFLRNLSLLIPSQKLVIIILWMLTLLVLLLQVKVKKSIKLTKIVKIEKVKIMPSERLDEFQLNLWEEWNL